jgi:peptide-methionine (R)-S-oxide reductase
MSKWLIPLFLFAAAVERTDDEWRELLGRERYNVMRRKGTEHAFLGRYVAAAERGVYTCAACENPLFHSDDKYDAGSGWPSFKKPIEPKSVYYLEDWSLPFKRYEVLCRGCDSHLGHVFNDGPKPKGLRYCINSIALTLKKG